LSLGKHISLEEARNKKRLDLFDKAHPSKGSMAKLMEALAQVATAAYCLVVFSLLGMLVFLIAVMTFVLYKQFVFLFF